MQLSAIESITELVQIRLKIFRPQPVISSQHEGLQVGNNDMKIMKLGFVRVELAGQMLIPGLNHLVVSKISIRDDKGIRLDDVGDEMVDGFVIQ